MGLFKKKILTKRRLQALTFVALFIAISSAIASIPSDTLIEFVGSENAYLLILALGVIGALTTFTGLPYHLILMSFAAGGINPIFLGISTALGVMVGDSTMFVIGKKAQVALPSNILTAINTLPKYIDRYPRLFNPLLIAYGALSPLSNDFVVASLSIAGYSYRRVIIPLTIGNIFFNIMIAYLGLYAYDWITQVL